MDQRLHKIPVQSSLPPVAAFIHRDPKSSEEVLFGALVGIFVG
jgi:hypothetical protein